MELTGSQAILTETLHTYQGRLGPKLAGSGPGEQRKKIGTPYLFVQPLKVATEKLVHNMSLGLPCQTQVLGPNQVGSELKEYHFPPHYDDDATVYSICHQKTDGYADQCTK